MRKEANVKIDKKSMDISTIPFSRFGSYFVISLIKNKLWIRDVRGGTDSRIFEMQFAEVVTILMTETQLNIFGKHGALHITFVNEDTLSFKGNLKVKYKYHVGVYDTLYHLSDDVYELASHSHNVKIGIKREKGTLTMHAPWYKIGSTKIEFISEHYYHFYLCSYQTVFSEAIINHKSHGYTYDYWSSLLPNDDTAAKYISWMNFVKAEGRLKRPAMLSSKDCMSSVWSWDNCFNAIFLAHIDSDLALDQFLMFAEHQDRSGMYPDHMNSALVTYSSANPPVYGWAYEMMCDNNPVFSNITLLEKVYDTISKLTSFWLKYRMSDEGLPFYNHGKESGWTNGIFFSHRVPMITPDLSAYLIRQLDFLSKVALDLGLKYESERLTKQADDIFEAMMKILWKDQHFVGYSFRDKTFIDGASTLQSLVPLIIHYRLNEEVKSHLMNHLRNGGFMTAFGLATESTNSVHYQSNGYWRGPIWAPMMLIFTSVLEEMGEWSLYTLLVNNFFDCMKKNGLYANYDAKRGNGLFGPSYSWTASTYMHLLIKHDYLRGRKHEEK